MKMKFSSPSAHRKTTNTQIYMYIFSRLLMQTLKLENDILSFSLQFTTIVLISY